MVPKSGYVTIKSHIFKTNDTSPYIKSKYYKYRQCFKDRQHYPVAYRTSTNQNDRFPSFDRSCAECVWRKSGGGFTEPWGDNSHCSR